MTIEEGIRTFLRTALSNQNVFSHKAPQGTAADPYMVFYRISPAPRHAHTGPSSLIGFRYQFSAYGVSQSATSEFADQARRVLNGFSGLMGDVLVTSSLWQGGGYGYNEATGRHQFWNDMELSYVE